MAEEQEVDEPEMNELQSDDEEEEVLDQDDPRNDDKVDHAKESKK